MTAPRLYKWLAPKDVVRAIPLEELPLYEDFLHDGGKQLQSRLPMTPESFLRKWTALYITGQGQIFGFWHNEELEGALGAAIIEDMYDESMMAMEIFFYIHPGVGTGWRKLFTAYIAWAKEQGVTNIFVSRLASFPKMSRFYKQLGFQPDSVSYKLAL